MSTRVTALIFRAALFAAVIATPNETISRIKGYGRVWLAIAFRMTVMWRILPAVSRSELCAGA